MNCVSKLFIMKRGERGGGGGGGLYLFPLWETHERHVRIRDVSETFPLGFSSATALSYKTNKYSKS